MKFSPLKISCPKCASTNITYSCEPDCCFNHVCGECLANFQLSTCDTGRRLTISDKVLPERDSCDPTAACVRCESLEVWTAEEDGSERITVCTGCGAILDLAID